MKRFLSLLIALTLLIALIPSVPAMALTQYGTVTGGWLRLRSSPSFSASTISSYYTGTVVKILGTSGSWYQVEAPDGKTGYMYGSYVTLNGGGTGTAYVTSTNGYGVRLRTGPGTGYRIIAVYSVGTAVTVLQTGTTWSRIQIGSRIGYMMNRFLTTGGGGGSGEPATIWSANGLGVRLRTGPGTSYSIIGVYSVGTTVNVISRGTVWDYISVGSRVGYMMNAFLHYASSNSVTAVTLNNTSPIVGSVLGAASITPSGATVSYSWYSGTTLVSSASTYTVQASDLNQQIKLTVVGTGSYSGTATSSPTSPVAAGTPVTSVMLNNNAPVVGDVLTALNLTPSGATVSYAWYVDGNLVSTQATYTVTAADVYKYVRLRVSGIGHYTGSAEVTSTGTVQPTGYIVNVAVSNTTNDTTEGNAYPNVGDLLTAKPDPATASATYRWTYVDDTATTLGTGATLAVTTAMVGRQLMLSYAGSGNYSGSGVTLSGTVVNKPNITSIGFNKTVFRYDPSPADPNFNLLTATVLAGTTDATADCTFEWYRGGVLVSGVTTSTYTLSAADRGQIIMVRAIALGSSSHAGSVSRSTTETVKQRLTSVDISGSSSATPGNVVVGDVLNPSLDGGSTTPNTVIANYTWSLNSINTSALAYTVPSGSVSGLTLTLSVTGKGDYYTDATLTDTATVEAAAITAINFPSSAPMAGNTYSVTLTPANATASATYAWTGHSATYTGSTITVSADDIGHPIALVVTPGAGYTGDPSILEQDTPSSVVARPITVAQFFGTIAVGQTVQINTDLPNDSVDHIDWLLDAALYHTSAEKSWVLPSGSEGKELTAVVYGKVNYAGSSKSIPGVIINASLSMAITLLADPLFEEPEVTEEPLSESLDNSPEVTDAPTPTEEPIDGETVDSDMPTDDGTQITPQPTAEAVQATPVPHSVSFRYESSGALAIGTRVYALPDVTENIVTYEWYLGDILQDDDNGIDYYTVTEQNLNNEVRLTVIVRYADDSIGTAWIDLCWPEETQPEPTPAPTDEPLIEDSTVDDGTGEAEPPTEDPTITDTQTPSA